MPLNHSPTQDERQKIYSGLLGLFLVTAIETLIWIFSFAFVKSEPGSQVFLGLSLPRLGVLAILLLIFLGCVMGLISYWRKKESTQQSIWRYFTDRNKFYSAVLIFITLFVGQISLLNFQAESWGKYAQHFNQIKPILWLGALVCAQIILFLLLFDPQRRFTFTRKSVIFGLLGISLLSIWFFTSQKMDGRPSITWMGYFQVKEFYDSNPGELFTFIKEMRAGIPPLISIAEIVVAKLTASTHIITREFYRLALLTSYLIAAFIFAENIIKGIISSAIAMVFMVATILISARNPEIYDIYYPSYLLLFMLLIQVIKSKHNFNYLNILWAVLAGLFLALAELSRPFVLLLMPIFLIFGYLSLRQLPKKVLISFLIPVVLISGGWHLKLLVFNNGQIFWSNHSGFNLYRAWEEIAAIPDPPKEPQTWDGRNQIHSQEHFLNSQIIQGAVFNFIAKNPGEAFSYMISRVAIFLEPRTSFFDEPELGGILINAYRLGFRACLVFWGIQLIILGYNLLKKPGLHLFSSAQNILLISTTITTLLLAISEKGEEARLLLAVLPFVSALPTYQKTQSSKRKI